MSAVQKAAKHSAATKCVGSEEHEGTAGIASIYRVPLAETRDSTRKKINSYKGFGKGTWRKTITHKN
jgi:hypothetical protein